MRVLTLTFPSGVSCGASGVVKPITFFRPSIPYKAIHGFLCETHGAIISEKCFLNACFLRPLALLDHFRFDPMDHRMTFSAEADQIVELSWLSQSLVA